MKKITPSMQTKRLLEVLQASPGRKFRASDLKGFSGVPKDFVRRRWTVDGSDALDPIPGVGMTKREPFEFWWEGDPSLPGPRVDPETE